MDMVRRIGGRGCRLVQRGSQRITDVLGVFYLATETGVNATPFSETIAALKLHLIVDRAQAAQLEACSQLSGRIETMADLLNLTMLVCAAVGSMALGVLTAYGIFRAGFALLRPRPRPAKAKVRPELAPE
jgi:hypothetical protein